MGMESVAGTPDLSTTIFFPPRGSNHRFQNVYKLLRTQFTYNAKHNVKISIIRFRSTRTKRKNVFSLHSNNSLEIEEKKKNVHYKSTRYENGMRSRYEITSCVCTWFFFCPCDGDRARRRGGGGLSRACNDGFVLLWSWYRKTISAQKNPKCYPLRRQVLLWYYVGNRLGPFRNDRGETAVLYVTPLAIAVCSSK